MFSKASRLPSLFLDPIKPRNKCDITNKRTFSAPTKVPNSCFEFVRKRVKYLGHVSPPHRRASSNRPRESRGARTCPQIPIHRSERRRERSVPCYVYVTLPTTSEMRNLRLLILCHLTPWHGSRNHVVSTYYTICRDYMVSWG